MSSAAVAKAGVIVGILDGLDAVVFNSVFKSVPAIRVFQFIASGAVGVAAFRGGVATALLGVFFHLLIATGAALVFYLLSRAVPILTRRPLLFGPVYGLAVFFFMRYVVVPLSAAPKQPPATAAWLANLVFSHVFFVGIPIALITSRDSATKLPARKRAA